MTRNVDDIEIKTLEEVIADRVTIGSKMVAGPHSGTVDSYKIYDLNSREHWDVWMTTTEGLSVLVTTDANPHDA